jgi:hypothetical protein
MLPVWGLRRTPYTSEKNVDGLILIVERKRWSRDPKVSEDPGWTGVDTVNKIFADADSVFQRIHAGTKIFPVNR